MIVDVLSAAVLTVNLLPAATALNDNTFDIPFIVLHIHLTVALSLSAMFTVAEYADAVKFVSSTVRAETI